MQSGERVDLLLVTIASIALAIDRSSKPLLARLPSIGGAPIGLWNYLAPLGGGDERLDRRTEIGKREENR